MPLSDKDFASWSPRDNSPEGVDFLTELEDEFRRYWDLPARLEIGRVLMGDRVEAEITHAYATAYTNKY